MQNAKENKMGVMPVGKLLFSMATPMMASMLILALYNVVDSIFVSRLGEDALSAVSLAYPVHMLMIAVAVGTAVGVNSFLARSLGERDFDRVNRIAMNGLFLALCSSLVFMGFGLLFSKSYMTGQTDNELIVRYGSQYVFVLCLCSFGNFFQVMLERILQSTGRTFYTMITQGVGAIINIILDPIMIFGLFGFPRLEVMGAAIATVIGQIAAAILALIFNQKFNPEVRLTLRGFRIEPRIIGGIYKVGAPSVVMQSIGSVMNYAMNAILLQFTSTATAVFGVYFKLQSVAFMPVFGLNSALVPIAAYNYGAKRKSRIMKALKIGVVSAVAIMLVCLAIFQFFPDPLLMIFDASETMLAIGRIALRIISLSFLFAGYCIVAGSLFQALGHGMMSMYVSIGRQLIILLPVAYLLSLSGNLDMVWWAFPVAESASVILSTIFLIYVYRRTLKNLPDDVPSAIPA